MNDHARWMLVMATIIGGFLLVFATAGGH